MNGPRDPALAGQRAGGGGKGRSVVSLAVRAGAHQRVLLLGAVRGGGQRVLGEGSHHGAAPIGEGWRGSGGGDRALVAGFLLQEFLLGRPWGWELQQAGGLQHRDPALPACWILAEAGGGGGGWAADLFWSLIHLFTLLPLYLKLCGTGGEGRGGGSSVT